MINKAAITSKIKKKALELGFDAVGVSKAVFLEEEAPKLENWLNQGKHGEMKWMENHFDMRLDPRKLMEGAKSVISFTLNYYPEKEIDQDYKISKYAYGKDYHKVIRKKLKLLLQFINEKIGEVHGRGFVDSAPIMDKVWAKKSGLAWVGKHSNGIVKNGGSYFFLAELVLDLELDYDQPINDYCGTCTKCIDACPTDAIFEPYKVDGSKCISYLTIELKNKIPEEFKGKMENWIFGCDICQDVCPWNRFSKPTKEKAFQPTEFLSERREFLELTEELFNNVFQGSAIRRTKHEGFVKNILFLNK